MKKNIIHFTNKLDYLIDIFNSGGFKLAYCGEIFNVNGSRISSAAHPMVCFSGYSENDFQNRNVTYGRYGIQMKQSWVQRKKVTPVLYVDESSQVALSLGKLLKARQGRVQFKLPDELRLSIIQLKCFTKNTRGYNSYFKINNFPFHEENEWRFVPTIAELKGAKLSQNLSTYMKNKVRHQIVLSGHQLDFSLEDIELIYVQNENEIRQISMLIGNNIPIKTSPWVTDLKAYKRAYK
ncbi:abortive infection system antitoxin AbiGi family protein [Aeromonas caviae]|uniref:abortive infection system antitoxin AbiGi family protein n=1 Tax=Aeromonas caviae TaxID=648 RepID=UPI0029D9F7B7|nr:abortive infection system antitoxin AbiGi family protein [Aeromonas caviae]MDX7858532.1 abortive infection system antitoxin AbiGi family protein [Aeromonas caviae]